MTSPRITESDLDLVAARTAALWPEARGARFFITGGTGFFGCWLLESLLRANRTLGLGLTATVLTRDPERFARKAPHLAHADEIELREGRMENLAAVDGRFDYALHVATETNPDLSQIDPRVLFERNVAGTEQFLALVRRAGVRKFLFTSSGAVYGPQPPDVPLLAEDCGFAPDPLDPRSAYGESKRVSELLCGLAGDGSRGVEGKIARCFAFAGPHLPLDGTYAIGNLLRDALAGGPLRIGGDGTPFRSYLYGADLAVWLWTVLFRGTPSRAYNIGSEAALSILELAERVRTIVAPRAEITVAQAARPGAKPPRYLPDTHRARTELGLSVQVTLTEAIRRSADWHRSGRQVFTHPILL